MVVVVKKYSNRRLYDTGSSSYVTLAEVAERIKRGEEVRVVDARTDEDITQQMLTQILFEDPRTAKLLPTTLLVQLIRMGESSLGEFFTRYVTWALGVYQQAQQSVATLGVNPFAPAALSWMNPLGAVFGREPAAPPPTDEVAALRREVEELRRELRKKR